ncbi:unnamed protein product [Heligmosomoides polygyrus]|uniref:COesterase domain-containing protein n=1 Tax=Heligmosomoides polygyrus TaxID=6339 RepID=A0A183FI23_HELPZ|nr:unnamed protein product [Heligmosomoides polygyrus]
MASILAVPSTGTAEGVADGTVRFGEKPIWINAKHQDAYLYVASFARTASATAFYGGRGADCHLQRALS